MTNDNLACKLMRVIMKEYTSTLSMQVHISHLNDDFIKHYNMC